MKEKKQHFILRLLKEARSIWKWLLLACFLCTLIIISSVAAPKLLGSVIDTLYAYWQGELQGPSLQ